MPELRKDPIVGRWVIIATERAKRPVAPRGEPEDPSGSTYCPFCEGHEDKTPNEIIAYRDRQTRPNEKGWRVRVDCETPAKAALANYDQLRLGFLEPAGCELRITPPGQGRPLAFRLLRQDQEIDRAEVQVAVDQIVEMIVPFARLGLKVEQPVQFFVELFQGDQSRDRAPREGAISLTCPSPDFERIMWDV